jgi:hypothetical protein
MTSGSIDDGFDDVSGLLGSYGSGDQIPEMARARSHFAVLRQ